MADLQDHELEPHPRPELLAGDTRAVIDEALTIARERLGMDITWLAEFTDGVKVFRAVNTGVEQWDLKDGDQMPGADSYCQRMLDGRIPSVVPDALEHPALRDLEVTHRLNIRAYVGVPLVLGDGELFGVLCSAAHEPRAGLGERDAAFLGVLAGLIGRELERRRLETTLQAERTMGTAIHALLAALEARDGYTGEHSSEVEELAVRVARRLGLDEAQHEEVRHVARLHDIGKVGIPDRILHKPGPLDDEEQAEMRRHPDVGAAVLEAVESLRHLAPAVRAEHERWDGEGYPLGLAGEAIPVASRVVFVCDAFHAMVSDRPYRARLSTDHARAELERGAGTQFWPDAVTALLAELA